MVISGVKALIDYDPDAETFRGEFVGINGGADFYGESIAELEEEGAKSLRIFLEMCQERGIEPFKTNNRKYKLADLLAQCEENAPMPKALTEWNNAQPVGEELFDASPDHLKSKLAMIDEDIEAGKRIESLSGLNSVGLELTDGMEIDLDSELTDDDTLS